MSIATTLPPVMIKPAAGPSARKRTLFSAYADGREVVLFDPSVGQYLTGRIMGVRLESGFMPPDSPHHFLVDLRVEQCGDDTLIGMTREVYVHTCD